MRKQSAEEKALRARMDAYREQEQAKLQAEYLKAHPELVQLAAQELSNWDYGGGSGVSITGNELKWYGASVPTPSGYLEWLTPEIQAYGGVITLEWYEEVYTGDTVGTTYFTPPTNIAAPD